MSLNNYWCLSGKYFSENMASMAHISLACQTWNITLVDGTKLYIVQPCISWFAPNQGSISTIALIMYYLTILKALGVEDDTNTSHSIRTSGRLVSYSNYWQCACQSGELVVFWRLKLFLLWSHIVDKHASFLKRGRCYASTRHHVKEFCLHWGTHWCSSKILLKNYCKQSGRKYILQI